MTDNKKQLKALQDELTQYKNKLSTIKRSFKGKTNKDTDRIYDSLKNVWEEAASSYDKLEAASAAEWEPLKQIASNTFSALKNSFEEYKNLAVEQLDEYKSQLEEFSQEQLDHSEEYIKKNPFKSVLFACAVGFIVGRVLK
jgi:ElaB/YqjD/DUF883 family membrane-anchored ribosome-binding protein